MHTLELHQLTTQWIHTAFGTRTRIITPTLINANKLYIAGKLYCEGCSPESFWQFQLLTIEPRVPYLSNDTGIT